jgi:IS6 family transposase
VRIAGKWAYLYRGIDSAGETIDFMLSPHRDLIAARPFLRRALTASHGSRPRVINVDGHPAYPRAVSELQQAGELSRRCRCRRSPYLNNIIEQDHRFIKKRTVASLGSDRRKQLGEPSKATRQCTSSGKGRFAG